MLVVSTTVPVFSLPLSSRQYQIVSTDNQQRDAGRAVLFFLSLFPRSINGTLPVPYTVRQRTPFLSLSSSGTLVREGWLFLFVSEKKHLFRSKRSTFFLVLVIVDYSLLHRIQFLSRHVVSLLINNPLMFGTDLHSAGEKEKHRRRMFAKLIDFSQKSTRLCVSDERGSRVTN